MYVDRITFAAGMLCWVIVLRRRAIAIFLAYDSLLPQISKMPQHCPEPLQPCATCPPQTSIAWLLLGVSQLVNPAQLGLR